MPEWVTLLTEEYLAFIISMLHEGDILEKVSRGAWPSNKGLGRGLLDCTCFCAIAQKNVQ
jgi:hypothetical protein